jgi:hypothetical protein
MKKEKRIIKCKNCGVEIDIWSGNVIQNAWQKNKLNYYEYKCICGTKDVLTIPIERK